jgi:hypothetical protein
MSARNLHDVLDRPHETRSAWASHRARGLVTTMSRGPRLVGIALAVGLLCAAPAAGQLAFGVSWQSPLVAMPGGCPGFPITAGDILTTAPGGIPLAVPAGPPCVLIAGGPSPAGPGLGLFFTYPPAVGVPPMLPPGPPVEVDDFSFGNDVPLTPATVPGSATLLYSVDPWAIGIPGTAVAVAALPAGPATDAACDVFNRPILTPTPICGVMPAPIMNLIDGNGVFPGPIFNIGLMEPSFAAPVPPAPDPGDNLDGLAYRIPFQPPGPPFSPTTVYFTLDNGPPFTFDPIEATFGTGSAAANGPFTGSDVLISFGGTPPMVYAPFAALGLTPADDVSGLAVWDDGDGFYTPGVDWIAFTLKRGSPTLGLPASGLCVLPITVGDVLVPPVAPGLPPAIVITAESLGLQTMRSGFAVNDRCDAIMTAADCNGNGMPDFRDIELGLVGDCNGNGVPDSCEIAAGMASDCDGDDVPDACALAAGLVPDCNGNAIPDSCDIASGVLSDCNGNGIPDECEAYPTSFGAPAAYAALPGSSPIGLALADLNGNGSVDAALASTSGSSLQVFFNSGAGAFGPAVAVTAGGAARDVAAGNLDADADVDLATVDAAGGSMTVWLNAGAGTFVAGATYAVGAAPRSLVIAELNGVGSPEIAVANAFSDSVSILPNIGGGAFGAPLTLAVGYEPDDIIAADLDGDGDLDLVTGNVFTISILTNTSAGGTLAFAPAVTLALPGQPETVAAGDLDGDGDVDLVAANSAGSNVWVLPNVGGGTFGAPLSFAFVPAGEGGQPRSLQLVDVSSDGLPEIVVGRYANAITILRNVSTPGSIAFTTPGIPIAAAGGWSGPNGMWAVALANLNADTRPDLVYVHQFGNSLSVRINTAAPTALDSDGDGELDPCEADLDDDGVVGQSDLGILIADYGCTSPPAVSCPGDIDGDGDTDLSDLGWLLASYGLPG